MLNFNVQLLRLVDQPQYRTDVPLHINTLQLIMDDLWFQSLQQVLDLPQGPLPENVPGKPSKGGILIRCSSASILSPYLQVQLKGGNWRKIQDLVPSVMSHDHQLELKLLHFLHHDDMKKHPQYCK
ncbi:hypothetical protein AMECASPLE_030449 [Ameca splendens]|uniref:Uncharacterized protein n=1 Tax=Ameca splendens TaxID=208324 RepID=A0ABV0YTV8_9TELE